MIEFLAAGPPADEQGELLAVPVFADRRWGPGADWAAEQLGDRLITHLDQADFTGKSGQAAALAAGGGFPFETLLLLGLGDGADAEGLRQAAGTMGKRTGRVTDVATTLHRVDVEGAAGAVAEGFLLGQYRFDKYRSEPKPSRTERVRFAGGDADAAVAAADRARIVAEAVMLARDLVNEPAAAKSPAMLAEVAAGVAGENGLSITVYEESAFGEQRFGGLAGVAAGAHNPARMVVLRYTPPDAQATLAMVGKGIVFDSGGLSLKPADAMETMKTDMAGAAAVLAAAGGIAKLGLPVQVVAITPLTENMPGGGAQRPGDVLRPRNGKTVEVLNTDAEGRLVLADGLSLAAEEGADLVVDLATLTGACMVALGTKIAGLWGNDPGAIEAVRSAAGAAGERVWEMPLPADYRKNIDSDVADMKNTGSHHGGSINAALFLAEFAGDGPWAHLDIAGPARAADDEHYVTKGGTGFGVRTLIELARRLAG